MSLVNYLKVVGQVINLATCQTKGANNRLSLFILVFDIRILGCQKYINKQENNENWMPVFNRRGKTG
jgi:hypothetical protein